uniref:C2H2-type domain-containing protein n=1 Tax=Sphaeramia orbicularis TaxID=375764 RepID=A0A673A7P7_9TELE
SLSSLQATCSQSNKGKEDVTFRHTNASTMEKDHITVTSVGRLSPKLITLRHTYTSTEEKDHIVVGSKKNHMTVTSVGRHLPNGLPFRHTNASIVEKDNKTYQCGNTFRVLSALFSHLHVHHKNLMYPCDMHNDTLVIQHCVTNKCHRRTHTGEKPYQCRFYNRSFITGSQCAKRECVKNFHKGQKLSSCTKCEALETSRNNQSVQ